MAKKKGVSFSNCVCEKADFVGTSGVGGKKKKVIFALNNCKCFNLKTLKPINISSMIGITK